MTTFVLSYYILIVALFLLAVIFLVLPLPQSKGIENYALSLRLLSISYGILGVYCIFKSVYPIDIIGMPFLLSANLQAHFLGMTYINMVNAQITTKNYVVMMLVPSFVLAIICTSCISSSGYHHVSDYDQYIQYIHSFQSPDVWFRSLWFLYYVGLSVYYVYKFFREIRNAKKNLEDYTSDMHVDDLNYIRVSFYLVILVVIDSVCITLCPDQSACTILNFIMLLLYICIGLVYVKSLKTYLIIQEAECEVTPELTENVDNWELWRKKIIENELYTIPGITIVQLAQELNTNRTYLSSMINQREGKNFNSFIKSLRIVKSQEIMKSKPNMTIAEICDKIGYTDAANFSRQFKEEVGISPVAWKQNNIKTE